MDSSTKWKASTVYCSKKHTEKTESERNTEISNAFYVAVIFPENLDEGSWIDLCHRWDTALMLAPLRITGHCCLCSYFVNFRSNPHFPIIYKKQTNNTAKFVSFTAFQLFWNIKLDGKSTYCERIVIKRCFNSHECIINRITTRRNVFLKWKIKVQLMHKFSGISKTIWNSWTSNIYVA